MDRVSVGRRGRRLAALGAPGWWEGKPLPFGGVFEILDDLSGPLLTIILIVLGIVAGVLVTLTAYDEVVTVTLTDTDVEVKAADKAKSFRRDQVDAVFTDGKTLVLQARDTSELVRQKTDHKEARLKAAFESHRYPWHDG